MNALLRPPVRKWAAEAPVANQPSLAPRPAQFRSRLLTLLAWVSAWFAVELRSSLSAADFDFSDWTMRIGGQVVRANPDGSFLIPNISAPDQFGPGGPGTRPDFLSDDFLRVVGTSPAGGIQLYAFSEFFQLRQGANYTPSNWTFTAVAPPSPESIRAVPQKPALTEVGAKSQIIVTGTLADGSKVDLTRAEQWTSYRSSNPSVLTVDPNGLATAQARGVAYITAVNEGATSVTQIDVVPGAELTTVQGLVQDGSGQGVEGISIILAGVGGVGTSLAGGSFAIAGVSAEIRIAGIIARGTVNGARVFGRSGPLIPVPSGITDAGIIVVRSCAELGIDCTDTDDDCIPDSVERAMRLNPQSPDSNNNGIPDGDEDTDGDGFPNCIEVLQGTDPGKVDTDDDGVSDRDEIKRYGTDPTNPDSDDDGLKDGDELRRGTDPLNPDTDEDGWNDGGEVLDGSDPLVFESVPRQTLSSLPLSFLNAVAGQVPRRTPVLVASAPVSFVNGAMETFAQVVPAGTPLAVMSPVVSYLNALATPRPNSLFLSASSPTVSYLNGVLAPPSPQWSSFSPVVSYRNTAAAKANTSGTTPANRQASN